MKEPTRQQIQEKIDELIADPTKNREEFKEEIQKWLQEMNLPPKVLFGETVDPIEKILEDLESYPNW